MKILAYNINLSTQEKIDRILEYDADVYILPEIACTPRVTLPEGYQMEWTGDYPQKGLGVIWKPSVKAEIPEWFEPKHQYFIPLLIDDKLIIAAWPTTSKENYPMKYPEIAMKALQEYAPYIKQFPTIISGDMNLYKGQSGETKKFSIQAICDYLKEMNVVSIYHEMTGEALGCESCATYYHQFKKNQPFFIDYTFSSIPVKSFKIGEWDSDISDHVPQFIEI